MIDYNSDVYKYLDASCKREEGGMIIKSPYVSVIQESREKAGRNQYSGIKNNESHGSWLGAVGYMIAIDHIGDKFYLPEKKERVEEAEEKLTGEAKSFLKTLLYFSDLSIEETFALYSLRCSLVHDFFLKNVNNENLTHHFSVTQGGEGELVTLPKEKWDGDDKTRNNENKTIINIELLADLVEEIHLKLLKLLGEGTVSIYDDKKLEFLQYRKPN